MQEKVIQNRCKMIPKVCNFWKQWKCELTGYGTRIWAPLLFVEREGGCKFYFCILYSRLLYIVYKIIITVCELHQTELAKFSEKQVTYSWKL